MFNFRGVLRILITLVYSYVVIKTLFPIVNAVPVNGQMNISFPVDVAEDRMVKPPRFPYDGPFGFYSSGILCIFDDVPYVGGWFGRSCAGPVAPFIQPTPPPTPPSTTPVPPTLPSLQPMFLSPQQMMMMQQMMMGWGNNYQQQQEEEEDDVEEIEGNPWEPDDDSVFIESYGKRASKPGFKLGDPSRHS